MGLKARRRDQQRDYLPSAPKSSNKKYYRPSPIARGGYLWVFVDLGPPIRHAGIHRQMWGSAIAIARENGGQQRDGVPATTRVRRFLLRAELETANHAPYRARSLPDRRRELRLRRRCAAASAPTASAARLRLLDEQRTATEDNDCCGDGSVYCRLRRRDMLLVGGWEENGRSRSVNVQSTTRVCGDALGARARDRTAPPQLEPGSLTWS